MHSLSFPPLIASSLTSRHILQFWRASYIYIMFVCMYELWVVWEQEVTHSGIPWAVGFNLLTRAVQECGSSLKHHFETKSWQTVLVPQSQWNCNGSPFYYKLRYQDQLQHLNSSCTGLLYSLVHRPRLALSFKHRRLPAWVPVENTPIWPSVSSYELPLIYLFHSQSNYWATNAGGEKKRNYDMLFPPRALLEGAFHMFPVEKVQEQNLNNLILELAWPCWMSDSKLVGLFDLRHTC